MVNTYIALLRGINVGGHRKIKMADLRALLTRLNFENVSTYIQSGNIVFQSSKNKQDCALLIKNSIASHYNFQVPVLVLTVACMENALNNCPFPQELHKDAYYTLLSEVPTSENAAIFKKVQFKGEDIELVNNCVYFYTSIGMGKAKYSNNLAENKLKVEATTRNYRTLSKIIEMAKSWQ